MHVLWQLECVSKYLEPPNCRLLARHGCDAGLGSPLAQTGHCTRLPRVAGRICRGSSTLSATLRALQARIICLKQRRPHPQFLPAPSTLRSAQGSYARETEAWQRTGSRFTRRKTRRNVFALHGAAWGFGCMHASTKLRAASASRLVPLMLRHKHDERNGRR